MKQEQAKKKKDEERHQRDEEKKKAAHAAEEKKKQEKDSKKKDKVSFFPHSLKKFVSILNKEDALSLKFLLPSHEHFGA